MLVLSREWTEQPPAGASINWANPLSRKLAAAYLPFGWIFRGSSGPYSSANCTPTQINTATASGVSVGSANTFVVVANLTTVSGTDSVAFGRIRYNGSNNYGAGLRFNGSTSSLEANKSDGTASTWAYDYVTGGIQTGRHVYAATIQNGVASVLWRDGAKLTPSGSFTPNANIVAFDSTLDAGQGTASGATAITGAINGGLEIGLYFDSVLSDAEIISISANPWQVFE